MGLDMGMTLADFVLRIAEAAGVARYTDPSDGLGGIARVPDDAHDLDKCVRAFNDGYRRFLMGVRAKDAKPYTAWSFLRPQVSITLYPAGDGPDNIQGDSTRYRLPFYAAASALTYWMISDGMTTILPNRCENTSIDRIRGRLQADFSTGRPTLVATAAMTLSQPVGGDIPWEVVFYPRPDRAYTASCQMRVTPKALSAMGERTIAGPQHDRTVLAYGLAEIKKLDANDPTRRDYALQEAEARELLEASIAMDLENKPRTLGQMTDPSTEFDGTITRKDAVYLMGAGPFTP